MAKDKNKKKMKKKSKMTTKQRIGLVLPQDKSKYGRELTKAEQEVVYGNLRKRVVKKSQHRWRDEGGKPVLLRLPFIGSIFDSVQEMLVEVDSFSPLYADADTEQRYEIGFELRVKSPMTHGRSHRLEVLRTQFKSTLFIEA